MSIDKKTEVVSSIERLVKERAKKYDCGLRTAFIQWTSPAEKQGLTYEQFKERAEAGKRGKII